jgi:hypothetical protein
MFVIMNFAAALGPAPGIPVPPGHFPASSRAGAGSRGPGVPVR